VKSTRALRPPFDRTPRHGRVDLVVDLDLDLDSGQARRVLDGPPGAPGPGRTPK
jgi:hypothetical protein